MGETLLIAQQKKNFTIVLRVNYLFEVKSW